jgi:hypothetical protein
MSSYTIRCANFVTIGSTDDEGPFTAIHRSSIQFLLGATMRKTLFIGLASLLLTLFSFQTVRGGIVNGDFQTGDLTGWNVSAFNGLGNPLAINPFIAVETVGGNSFVVFDTGNFSQGLFVASLQQTYAVEASLPFLNFDFSLPVVTSDVTGTGTSPFRDSFVVSIAEGANTFELLLVDSNGALADPFGTAPGTVALGASINPSFNLSFGADLSLFAGKNVTLSFVVSQEDDGFKYRLDPDDIVMAAGIAKVPEPSSMVLISSCIALCSAFARFNRKRTANASTEDLVV